MFEGSLQSVESNFYCMSVWLVTPATQTSELHTSLVCYSLVCVSYRNECGGGLREPPGERHERLNTARWYCVDSDQKQCRGSSVVEATPL